MRLGTGLIAASALLGTVLVSGAQNLRAQAQNAAADILDGAKQTELVRKVAALIDAEYVFADVASRTASELNTRADNHAYDAATSSTDFAARLSQELLELTHDKHVRVRFAPGTTGPRTAQELDPSLDNFGIRRVEWLPNRVAYLRIDRFYEADESRKAFDAALTLLAPASAVVIDLRENRGGSDANNLLASYFFAERVLFNELRWRKEEPDVIWTDPAVRPQLANVPLFILTSERTFSAGEAFAYSLQQRKRAVVIGEATGGGANPNQYFPLAPGWAVSISVGKTVNPVSQSNWEGAGVQPDVKVAAADALDAAIARLSAK